MLDNVKRLVSKHIHLTGTWARRLSYEWPEAQTNVQSTATAIKSTYVIPKHVFKLYKSATIHTKLQRKIPATFYALGFLIVVGGFLFYRLYQSRLASVVSPEVLASSVPNVSQPTALDPAAIQRNRFDFVPVVANHPESAPAYAEIVKVKDFPRLAGCVQSATRCTCYTQQATEYSVNVFECQDFVKRARFNPYHVEDSNRVARPLNFNPHSNPAPTSEPVYTYASQSD